MSEVIYKLFQNCFKFIELLVQLTVCEIFVEHGCASLQMTGLLLLMQAMYVFTAFTWGANVDKWEEKTG